MNLLTSVLLLVFVLHVIRATLYAVYFWQLKEYRFDRMWTHISTHQGKRWVASPLGVLGWALLIIYALGMVSILPLLTLYGIEIFFFLRNPILKKPVFTFKATTLVTIGIVFSLFGTLLLYWLLPLQLLIFDKLRALVITISVLSLNRITNLSRNKTAKKARQKIKNYKKLKKIGITGSYGKTSTKEFLATILSQKYYVAKTPEMVNTAIGVAQSVIKNLHSDSDIFIAEMGAYKIGEIAQIADIIKPSIGIITGINEQHLDLFGSLGNIKKAKFELVKSLPSNGVAILNGEDANMQELIKDARGKKNLTVKTYGFATKHDVYANSIVVSKNSVSFTVHIQKKKISVVAHVLGKQFIPNILAAIATASILGMSHEEIEKGVSQIRSPQMTMAKVNSPGGTVLVNDTFNANPVGVKAAIDYMQVYSGKKILVLTPLIELGDQAAYIHKELGKHAIKLCDYIILTNKNYYANFVSSASADHKKKVMILGSKSAQGFLQDNLSKDDVVVFEGKEAYPSLEFLSSKRE